MCADSPSNHAISLDEAAPFLHMLLKQAGHMLRAYFGSRQLAEKQKPGVDVTTEADEIIDRLFHEQLAARFPGCAFLTEETPVADLSAIVNADNLWVIDPLDGTVNFTRGNPNVAISAALLHKGEISLGMVYLPVGMKLYEARADQEGASLNGAPIRVSRMAQLRETVVAFDWSWDLAKRKDIIRCLDRLSDHVRQIKAMGSAAADLASLAEGKIDVYIHTGLKPWDVAAAALIVRKAGGIVSSLDSSQWTPFNPQILAANERLHSQILSLIG
jgi:myo-inositol-1(or 4)-monophosphatase